MDLLTSVRILFLLVSAGHVSSALSKVPWLLDISPRSVCTAPAEVICSTDCSEVLVCLGDGAGGFDQELVAACGSGQRCSQAHKACVDEGASECHPPLPEDAFTCHSVGDFPDPYDCQKYHICVEAGGDSIRGTCTGAQAYNPLRADCSLTTSDRVCTQGPIPACTQLGQMGAVPENPSIYYLCKQQSDGIGPELYKCDGNLVFDVDTAQCVAP